jgi:cysteinyl-tRNA synthetase
MEQASAEARRFRDVFLAPAADGADGSGWERLEQALDNDFNTHDALTVMQDWRRHGHVGPLRRGLDLFGLGSLAERQDAPPDLLLLAQQRLEAREGRDFDTADRLRVQIERAGWEVRDVADGFQLVPRT